MQRSTEVLQLKTFPRTGQNNLLTEKFRHERADVCLNLVQFFSGISQLRYSTESSFSGHGERNYSSNQRTGLRETNNVHADSIRCGKCEGGLSWRYISVIFPYFSHKGIVCRNG